MLQFPVGDLIMNGFQRGWGQFFNDLSLIFIRSGRMLLMYTLTPSPGDRRSFASARPERLGDSSMKLP